MRILIICSQYPPDLGGGGALTFYLCDTLARLPDIEVYLLTSEKPNKPKKFKVKDKNLWITRSDFNYFENLPYPPAAYLDALELCQEIKPDIIHGQHIIGATIGLYLKTSFNIPLVVTLHKTPIEWDSSIIKRSPTYSFLNFLSSTNLIDMFIAGSNIFKTELQNIGIPQEKTKLIYHGVPIQVLKRLAYGQKKIDLVLNKTGLAEDQYLIVCPARLDKRKKLECFVEAAGIVRERLQYNQFIFLITGTVNKNNKKEQEYKEELENIADRHNIKDSLKFESFDFDHIPALLNLADVCVLPSVREGLGLSLLEAMAIRTPVIGANGIGINEIIKENGKHGLLFTPEDADDLAFQIIRVLTDTGLVSTLKKEGFKRISTTFNADRMVREHINLYNELIKKRPTNCRP